MRSHEENILFALENCMTSKEGCQRCPYDRDENGHTRDREICTRLLFDDLTLLISDLKNVIRLLEDEKG